jgi:Leucine-rich repeat (LRR) protein
LESLGCNNNKLSNLDLTKSTNLKTAYLSNNKFTNIDFSQNIELINLSCTDNDFTSLDFSKNIELAYLNCTTNKLVELNIKNGNNNKLNSLDCRENTELNCIQVDDKNYADSNYYYWNKDSQSIYKELCN